MICCSYGLACPDSVLLQVAVIEYAREMCGLKEANSTEFDSATTCPAVVFMPEGSKTHKGGTMRLGTRRTLLETVDCITAKLYQVSGVQASWPSNQGCQHARPELRRTSSCLSPGWAPGLADQAAC